MAPGDADRGAATRAFLRYAISEGAQTLGSQHAAGLPADARPKVLELLSETRNSSG